MDGENICRICLVENAERDWNNFLQDESHLTYKDCYYSFTRLEPSNDYFSTMLCSNCSNCLENINLFISKAIETHNVLIEKLRLKTEDDIKQEQGNFEIILVEDADVQQKIQSFEAFEDCSEDNVIGDEKCSITESSLTHETAEKNQIQKEEKKEGKKLTNQLPPVAPKPKRRKKKKQIETPTCCTICSKVLCSKYNAIRHEKTHRENRERNCICPECGLKFYDKGSLGLHTKIHSENREKKFKCEFCEKAFFNMGALNVHRRIHLGLMVKCHLCSKEFFRNVELHKHMNTHSSTFINVEVKKRLKYVVQCKHCGKKIQSTSFKSHMAAHLNEPIVKCSICNKEYFNRESCRHHIRNIHMKTSETVNDYIVVLKANRLTHLYIKQNADVEEEEE